MTTIRLIQVVNGTESAVGEQAVECDLSFSVSRDHGLNGTTIVGHVGRNAFMTFETPGMSLFLTLSEFMRDCPKRGEVIHGLLGLE